ncbi:MAG: hypothetical protein LBS59_04050 [Puniceicoccales bacterium]|jgi:arabinofuranosyltransferase|nr:hypothetical protein [Puniceicoccales bacterium]
MKSHTTDNKRRGYVLPAFLCKVEWNPVVVTLLLVYATLLLLSAWISDDGFITYGTAKNFLNGHGLRYNIAERVQSFTSPLMLFCMSGVSFFTGEGYFSTLAINIATAFAAVSILAFVICKRVAADDSNPLRAVIPLTILIFSVSFLDFSTSGLENSLAYLLLAIFCVLLFSTEPVTFKRLVQFGFVTSLLLLTRHDMLLLVLPALLYIFLFKNKLGFKPALTAGTLGLLPFIAWEVFSLIYYGFLFPNTAYAKLNSGIPVSEYLINGLVYFLTSFAFDPIGVMSIFVAVVSAGVFLFLKKEACTVALSIGVLFYCVYVLRIGGDFMAGRFFAAPIFLASVIFSRFQIGHKETLLCAALIAVIGMAKPFERYTKEITENLVLSKRKVADEQWAYRWSNALVNLAKGGGGGVTYERHPFYSEYTHLRGERVVERDAIGMLRLACPPPTHILDRVALSDPLLARLPAFYNTHWIHSHFYRWIPAGYKETLASGTNKIADKQLRAYYDVLSDITRSPIFSVHRFENILKMNIGYYDHLIDFDRYRYPRISKDGPPVPVVEVETLANVSAGTSGGKVGLPKDIGYRGIACPIPTAQRHSRKIKARLSTGNIYDIALLSGGSISFYKKLSPPPPLGNTRGENEFFTFELSVPTGVSKAGFDTIRIVPYDGTKKCRVEYIRLQ